MSESSAEGRRRAGGLREVRLRHAVYYIDLLDRIDRRYMEGGDDGQQVALALFDQERGQLDVIRAWLWVQPPDPATDSLVIAEARAALWVSTLRDPLRSVRIPQQEHAAAAALRQADLVKYARFLSNIGNAYVLLGKSRQSLQYFERSLNIAQSEGSQLDEGVALDNLGLAYAELGDLRAAISYIERGLEISRFRGDKRGKVQ